VSHLTTDAPNRRTTSEVILALDGTFASLANGVAAGDYAFWLGSGISRGVVPGLPDLLEKGLKFLQERVQAGEPDCPNKVALRDIFEAGGLSEADVAAIDLDQTVGSWPNLDDLLNRLTNNYSKVLEVPVGGEDEEDFLLWEAIDVCGTYANSSLQPDAEHLCIAILILEGAVRVAASANWDGLIEESVRRLSGGSDYILRVLVLEDEFRLADARSDLIKFHGCAVMAKTDPLKYRKMLVARKSQIAAWIQNPDYAVMLDRLTDLVATRPTLMVGLSGQDANIQEIFSQAEAKLTWSWPSDPIAIVFAEERIGQDQRVLLKLIYGDKYHPNRAEIDSSARSGAFAKPLLLGLVLYTLSAKLCLLVNSLQVPAMKAAELTELREGIHSLRDRLGEAADGDFAAFALNFVRLWSLVLTTFRTGVPPTRNSERYEPLSAQPIHIATADPNFPLEAMQNLAVAISLLGKGAARAVWELTPGDPLMPNVGVCQIVSVDSGRSNLFIVQDSAVLSRLEASGILNLTDPDVLVIHACQIPPTQRRSPAAHYGRAGSATGRQVAIGAVLASATGADDLFERFCLEAAI
jgi:hypothetical protein